MAKDIPTEADLGIEVTAEERSGGAAPVIDDIEVEGGGPEVVADAEQQGEPETDAKAAAEQEQQPDKKGPVNYGAFHAERQERIKAQQRAQVVEERLTAILERMNTPKAEEAAPEEIPDRTTQPIQYMEYLERKLGAVTQQVDGIVQQTTQQREVQTFRNTVAGEFSKAVTADPLVRDAYGVLVDRFNGIADAYDLSGPERQEWLNAQVDAQAKDAFAMRRPLGEHVKALAQAYGWDGKPRQQAQQQTTTTQRDLGDLAKKQERHMSLSDAGGDNGVAQEVTAKDLASMSQADFKAWMDTNGKKWDRVAGRA